MVAFSVHLTGEHFAARSPIGVEVDHQDLVFLGGLGQGLGEGGRLVGHGGAGQRRARRTARRLSRASLLLRFSERMFVSPFRRPAGSRQVMVPARQAAADHGQDHPISQITSRKIRLSGHIVPEEWLGRSRGFRRRPGRPRWSSAPSSSSRSAGSQVTGSPSRTVRSARKPGCDAAQIRLPRNAA